MTTANVIQGLPERIERKIVLDDSGCWEWTAYVDPRTGYGHSNLNGRISTAHRIVYELLVGPIPEGLVLDHLCRNRGCVNPAHLEPVTDKENLLRGEGPTAKKAAQVTCIKGHPFNEANTAIKKINGTRICCQCRKEQNHAYHLAHPDRKKRQ